MYVNKVKEKLQRGKNVIGMLMHEQSRDLVEILGLLGFDYLFLDTEHGPLTTNELLPLIVAAERRNILPIIRTSSKNEKEILRYLEIGAMGLIFPDVQTAAEVAELVRVSRYYPQGHRSMATMRAADYGIAMTKETYRAMSNQQIMCIMQIESEKGYENHREIMSVPGVDAVIFGPNDFSQDIGIPGQNDNSRVKNAIQTILADGKELGIPIMHAVTNPSKISDIVNSGASMLFVDYKSFLISSARPFVESLRQVNQMFDSCSFKV